MLKAIIIDDEESGIVTLKLMLERIGGLVKLIAFTTSAHEGIQMIEREKPDLVFLDISMPEMNGFELLESLEFRDFKLVFTTAHQEYAITAIKNRAFDYLLKPVQPDELVRCLNNLAKEAKPEIRKKSPDIIEIQIRDGILFIKLKEIIRLEASGSYTFFYLDNGVKHLVSKNLKENADLLVSPYFYRCHNSHVINLNKVDRLIHKDGLFIRMNDGSVVELSRKNREEFLEKLKNL